MKILLPIIVILIIIVFSIIILNSNRYFKEDFSNGYNQNTIEDLIPISYLPFNPYLKDQINEYTIIEVYKEVLKRSPTLVEIKEKAYLTKTELMEELYNSNEYEKMIKVQDNLAVSGVENSIARRNLIKKIISIYKFRFSQEPDNRMLLPLRDCYIHLRNNPFLFTAFIHSTNYIKFEKEVLSTTVLTKRKLLEIFDKYYNLLELKILAEDKIKFSRGNPDLSMIATSSNDINYEKLRDELNKLAAKKGTELELQGTMPLDKQLEPSMAMSDYPLSELPLLSPKATENPKEIQNKSLSELRTFFQSKLERFDNYADVNDVYNNTTVGNIYSKLKSK